MAKLHIGYRLRWLVLPTAVLLLAACAGGPADHYRTIPVAAIHDSVKLPPRITAEANRVLFHAIGLIGTPYVWGGNTPETGFDCSGLVDYVYRTAVHMKLPYSSLAMSKMHAPKITRIGQLAGGDLLFFRTEGNRVSHVAIYVGNGRFVHAPNTGGRVRLDSLTEPYWNRRFAFARRVLEQQPHSNATGLHR